jgi:hypothetical protein
LSELNVQSFLHTGSNEEVFFFCTNKKVEANQSPKSIEIKLCVIDLKLACDPSTSHLQAYESSVFLLPLQENNSFVLEGLVKELVLYKFGIN